MKLCDDNKFFQLRFEVQATLGTPPDYRYAVGVNFINPQKNELAILDKFLMKPRVC